MLSEVPIRNAREKEMRRDTLVFTLAGVVFGFAFGYMAAGWDVMPRPVSPVAAPASVKARVSRRIRGPFGRARVQLEA
jgi:hypothetical protein